MNSPTRMTICALALASVLASPAAFAEQSPSARTVSIGSIDTDGDGKLSPGEHAVGSQKTFEVLDENKDGKITSSEIDIVQRRVAAQHKVQPSLTADEQIKMVDADRDGTVSHSEHKRASQSMFDTMDSDKDGFVTVAERSAAHEKLLQQSRQN